MLMVILMTIGDEGKNPGDEHGGYDADDGYDDNDDDDDDQYDDDNYCQRCRTRAQQKQITAV